MSQYLVKNGVAFAHVLGSTSLKSVRASTQSCHDALNAEFPTVLVNASEFQVSSAEKYQREILEAYAKPLPGGRPDDFLIF
jgi:hypothetical protein